jgi:hypothetical protein
LFKVEGAVSIEIVSVTSRAISTLGELGYTFVPQMMIGVYHTMYESSEPPPGI